MTAKLKNAFRPALENLENRIHPSWVGTPPAQVNFYQNPYPTPPSGGIQVVTGNDLVTVKKFNTTGNYVTNAAISDNEIDYYSFVAQRHGIYRFDAQALQKYSIDTVAAVFAADGRQVASNDDASGSTRDSSFTAQLLAGKTYVFGVTNYRGSPNGAYRATITAPTLQGWRYDTNRAGANTSAYVRLSGNQLYLELSGNTYKTFGSNDHYLRVRILDLNGQPIHTGYWGMNFRTVSKAAAVFGGRTSDIQTWSIDLSGWDLSRVSRLEITAYHW